MSPEVRQQDQRRPLPCLSPCLFSCASSFLHSLPPPPHPQVQQARPYDTPADVWSLAVTMFQLAAGHLPLWADRAAETTKHSETGSFAQEEEQWAPAAPAPALAAALAAAPQAQGAACCTRLSERGAGDVVAGAPPAAAAAAEAVPEPAGASGAYQLTCPHSFSQVGGGYQWRSAGRGGAREGGSRSVGGRTAGRRLPTAQAALLAGDCPPPRPTLPTPQPHPSSPPLNTHP